MTSSVLGILNTKQSVEVALFFESHRDEILDFWEKLVTIESGTMDKNDLDIMRDYLAEAFQSIGGAVQTISYKEAGDLIVVDFFSERRKVRLYLAVIMILSLNMERLRKGRLRLKRAVPTAPVF